MAKKRTTKTSKFIREYGMTMVGLANKYQVSTSVIYILDARGQLHDYIAEQESKNKEVLQNGSR